LARSIATRTVMNCFSSSPWGFDIMDLYTKIRGGDLIDQEEEV
jgi:hypothetical protein